MNDTKKPEFSKEVAEKYEISPNLNPQVTIMPVRFGKQRINLETVEVKTIDAFVEKYKDQPYFKLKAKAGSSASGPGKV